MKRVSVFLFLLSIFVIGCKDQKTNSTTAEKELMTPKEISNNDYYLEYNEGYPDRYYLNDNTVMNGTFRIVEDSILKEELYLENGVHNGKHSYFKNNVVVREMNYKNGLKEGESKGYFENGKVQSISTYKNDSLTGKSISYDQTGKIESERGTVDGLGFNKLYKEGKLVAEEYDYQHSSGLISIFKTYDQNGIVTNVLGFDSKGMNNEILYVLDENHIVLDSVNPRLNPKKAMQLFQKIGPQYMR